MLFNFSADLIFFLLFVTGLLAGTVDAIAGGGGLISLPMLLALGFPPHIALGTNKLQTSIGTFVATNSYYRQGLFSFKTLYKGLIFGVLGAILGAVAGQILNSDILKKIIPILLLVILIYTIFSPKLGFEDKKPKLNEFWFYVIFGFVMGFYDGFFGPGTGSIWVFSLTFFLGYNLKKATAYTKVFNLKSNIIATICFALGQNIDYRIAICMGCGQLIGGKLGAHLAIKNGAKLIRPIFIAVISLAIITLVYKSYNDSGSFMKSVNIVGFASTAFFVVLFIGIIFYWNKRKYKV